MTARERILAIRLMNKIEKQPDYAKQIGIEENIKVNVEKENAE